MSPIKVAIRSAEVYSRGIKTRMPFKFGKSVMTEMPIIHLKLVLDTPFGEVIGASAFGIPPLWFDKNSTLSTDQHRRNLLYSLYIAIESYSRAEGFLWEMHESCGSETLHTCENSGLNGLTSSFGIALVDSALVDGLCRGSATPFYRALTEDLFGFGTQVIPMLPSSPLTKIAIRHTVGLADPIFTEDIETPLNDGLPESLEQVLSTQGIRFIKIKITSDISASISRLQRISKALEAVNRKFSITLDGNEQFSSMENFKEFVTALTGETSLRDIWEATLWVEEPVMRQNSLLDEVRETLKSVSRIKPVIIDESGGWDGAALKALELGYSGISAKNCKGIFRTLRSFVTLNEYRQAHGAEVILSSEDLTNAPLLPLHQDLCVAAALGISHSERNGHHYIKGFAFLSELEMKNALREFPSLYTSPGNHLPTLNIQEGDISLTEINQWGYGAPSLPDWDSLDKIKLPETPSS